MSNFAILAGSASEDPRELLKRENSRQEAQQKEAKAVQQKEVKQTQQKPKSAPKSENSM